MNYKQIKNAVLQLLNQYSIAGTQVPGSYNNQQDYLSRIPNLVNDAIMEIAATARKIPVVLRLSELDGVEEGKTIRYSLPEDFFQFKSGGTVVTTVDGRVLRTNVYQTQGRSHLLIPKDAVGDYTIEYYRYPKLLGDDPKDNEELDCDPLACRAVPYYVAAHLVIHDEAFLYQAFYNKYEDILAKSYPAPYASVSQVHDAYGGGFL